MKLIKKVYNHPLLYSLIKYVGPFFHGHLKIQELLINSALTEAAVQGCSE